VFDTDNEELESSVDLEREDVMGQAAFWFWVCAAECSKGHKQ
jgi:hypothetical protein